ncbi:MAG: hypothetical protein KDB00_14150, partial [Planctomycetales bacterium]|nr:hypothetical protein [Planctomycetales bacterium]
MIEIPTSIQEKLDTVVRQNWRAELVHRVSMAAAVGMLAIIGLIVADVLFGLRSAPIRWAIWVAGLGIIVAAIRYIVIKLPRRNEQLLGAAWKIESSHPAMEERLTSTVQFLNDDSRHNMSPQLINALVDETSISVSSIDAHSIPTRSSQIPATVVAVLATALVFFAAIWPESVLASLKNLVTPWSPYAVPTLSANISPGDVTIAEGDSVTINVTAVDDLDHPTLEIIRGDVVESHAMVATSFEASTFTLADVSQDAVYRIHSGGLYSVPHTITVHPKPLLTAITGHLKFPDYTHLDPLAIDQVIGPIEVPPGTAVTLTATSNDVAVDGVIRWNSESQDVLARKVSDTGSTGSVQFEWTFGVEPETELVGSLAVRSEHDVSSMPHRIEINGLEDSSPRVEITTPSLRQLTMRRDDCLPIRYRVSDDFGVSKIQLILKFGAQGPVAQTCPVPEVQPGDQRSWIGETSLELTDVPADCDEVSLWLRIADNRPDEFGGAQVVESERIHITLDDRADSLGQQQILADRQMIEQSIDRAIEQMWEAAKAAEALQSEQGGAGGRNQAANDRGIKADHPGSRADHIDALRQETAKAKQTLDQLASKLQEESNLFKP